MRTPWFPRYQGYSGAFAGFWWSHLKRGARRAFFDALHRALAPGAMVVLLDNLYVEGSSTPVSHADAGGNTWQQRSLADGTRHLVLKNLPVEKELLADARACGSAVEYIALGYYWVLKYVVAAHAAPDSSASTRQGAGT